MPTAEKYHKIIQALSSETRREILRILAKRPMTTMEVYREINKEKLKIKYRESVFKALEKLVSSGIVEKYYNKKKGICYKLLSTTIEIDLTKTTMIRNTKEGSKVKSVIDDERRNS